MAEATFKIEIQRGRIECAAWIDKQRQPDGSYKLIGIGRRTDYDEHGAVIAEKIEPTGVTGWAPADAFDDAPRSWWRRILEAQRQVKRLTTAAQTYPKRAMLPAVGRRA